MEKERHPDERIIAALWVGRPETLREFHHLRAELEKQLRIDEPDPMVIFEERMLPIEDLVLGFTDESVFVESAVFQAQKKGIAEASLAALYFSASGRPIWRDYPPDGKLVYPNGEIVYLGLFAFPADDAYRED